MDATDSQIREMMTANVSDAVSLLCAIAIGWDLPCRDRSYWNHRLGYSDQDRATVEAFGESPDTARRAICDLIASVDASTARVPDQRPAHARPPFVETDRETVNGCSTRLSRSIRVF